VFGGKTQRAERERAAVLGEALAGRRRKKKHGNESVTTSAIGGAQWLFRIVIIVIGKDTPQEQLILFQGH
jgi:hypothetical protein